MIELGDNMTLVLLATIFGTVFLINNFMDDQGD